MKPIPLPDELLTRWETQFGEKDLMAILQAFQEDRHSSFRINTLITTAAMVMKQLQQDAIHAERIASLPDTYVVKKTSNRTLQQHPCVESGSIYLQGLTSIIPALVLDPKPGEMVLDLCAAPGSKTSQIAVLMKNTGTIIACEKDEVRFQKLLYTIERQQVRIATPLYQDATSLHLTYPNTFDRILADVPCSAEGRMQFFDPRTYRYWSIKNINEHAKLQKRLLRSAIPCLKPGGILVYSTCTLAPEENGEIVAWIKETFPEIKQLPAFPHRIAPLSGARFAKDESVTFLPTREHEGFFVAKFERKK